jgi:hypothetical protein
MEVGGCMSVVICMAAVWSAVAAQAAQHQRAAACSGPVCLLIVA